MTPFYEENKKKSRARKKYYIKKLNHFSWFLMASTDAKLILKAHQADSKMKLF
jgi:hypothetical protein